jgi:hypothetical protein
LGADRIWDEHCSQRAIVAVRRTAAVSPLVVR